jgi:CBS domain-containing protein
MPEIAIDKQAQRLVIYIGESDHWRGRALYAALLDALKSHGLAGATVTRGVAGFGAHSRIHTASIVRLSEDLPLRVEVIDSPDKIARALEFVAPMVTEGLITLEEVQVLKYTHRYLNPLPADRLVSEVMTREVVTLLPEMAVAQAWEKMLARLIKALPVISADGQVVGMLTDQDLFSRAGVQQRLAVAERLDSALLNEELARLRASPLRVADVMSKPVITARAREALGVAAARMVQHDIKRLPVVDDTGKLVGVLSRVDILRQVTGVKQGERPSSVPAGAAQAVRDVMQPLKSVVRHDADLATIAGAFVECNSRRLIVVDHGGRAIGLVSDGDVVSRVQPQQRRGVLAALGLGSPVPPSDVTARDLMSPGVLTVAPDLDIVEAVRQMLATGRKWMVVIDDQGRPLGLVDRQAVLQAVTAAI